MAPFLCPSLLKALGVRVTMTSNRLLPEFTVTGGENVIVCYPVIKTQNKSHG